MLHHAFDHVEDDCAQIWALKSYAFVNSVLFMIFCFFHICMAGHFFGVNLTMRKIAISGYLNLHCLIYIKFGRR
ncbi:hypothetical protein GCM10009332_05570 [Shewanella gelidii]|uniref:Uncharacterized protein n=1 Tax=Shewanella gelidii TaxID=1642821 RepID=A0A917N6H9_9GAMM|nr:hypothetical protein GCM10009332_05570 [Shewanella gelidii]